MNKLVQYGFRRTKRQIFYYIDVIHCLSVHFSSSSNLDVQAVNCCRGGGAAFSLSYMFFFNFQLCHYVLFRQGFQLLNLLYQIRFFVIKLLVVGAIIVELGQKIHQLVLISQENVQDGLRFVGVSHKNLQNRKPM